MYSPNRLDFLDLKGWYSWTPLILTGFRPVHVGLKLGDLYLVSSRDEPSYWTTWDLAEPIITPFVEHSFDLGERQFDPVLVTMSGQGHMVSNARRLFFTEFAHYGADRGLWKWRPQRTSCVGVATTVMKAMGIHTTMTTSQCLFHQLKEMSGLDIRQIK